MSPRAVLGNHTGYVNVDRMVLMSDIVQLLAPERFVLEILETVTFDEALFKRCSELRRAGFRLALDEVSQVSGWVVQGLSYGNWRAVPPTWTTSL